MNLDLDELERRSRPTVCSKNFIVYCSFMNVDNSPFALGHINLDSLYEHKSFVCSRVTIL